MLLAHSMHDERSEKNDFLDDVRIISAAMAYISHIMFHICMPKLKSKKARRR
jgi:hypothetical protein